MLSALMLSIFQCKEILSNQTPDSTSFFFHILCICTLGIEYNRTYQFEPSAQYCVRLNLKKDGFDGETSLSVFLAIDIFIPESESNQDKTTETYYITDDHSTYYVGLV